MTDDPTSTAPRPIDRAALLARHDPQVHAVDPRSPLQVGNGELAFALDVTGLQTFPDAYPGPVPGSTLLGTMAQWGWHRHPGGEEARLRDTMRPYETARGPVPYVDLGVELWGASADGTGGAGARTDGSDAERYLRANPHRLDLVRVGLLTDHGPRDLTDVEQRLDLRSGTVRSSFRLGAAAYTVVTAVHPERDAIAVRVRTSDPGAAALRLRFAYGSEDAANACDWDSPDAHTTDVARAGGGWLVSRVLDDDRYWLRVHARDAALSAAGPHELVLRAEPAGAPRTRGGEVTLSAVLELSPRPPLGRPLDPLTVDEVLSASAAGWAAYWDEGGVVDLSAGDDPRAGELERRVVLSQYLTAVNSSGSTPPAETGLLLNSWRGKFHLEMHWWHGAHFAQWGRPGRLERSLAWYLDILEEARATARRQGLPGARWPKCTDPSGRETPSSIGPFLVWQQPHPVYLAELVYRARPTRETLERWWPLVHATATFMAAFPTPGPAGLELGPPVIPAQESYSAERARLRNPTFELAYWRWGLRTAAAWLRRLALPDDGSWSAVADALTPPTVRDGVYAAIGTPPWTVRTDHPSMLAALGVVPGTGLVDRDVMTRTLEGVLADWDWPSTWGWDYPMVAMTAARLGRPDLAVDALLAERPKNTYLPNGHNYQTSGLPVYLPGNGSLLAAVGLMAAGHDGSGPVPGFGPGWRVAHEGVLPLP